MLDENPVSITLDVYCLSAVQSESNYQLNSYLLINYDEAVIINPGSAKSISQVMENLRKVLSNKDQSIKLKAILVAASTPDSCSGLQKLCLEYPESEIYCHPDIRTQISFWDAGLQICDFPQEKVAFVFQNGRAIEFIPSPFFPTKEAVMFYDSASQVLFSGYLGSSFTSVFDNTIELDSENQKIFFEGYSGIHANLNKSMMHITNLGVKIIAPLYGSPLIDNASFFLEYVKSKVAQNDNISLEQENELLRKKLDGFANNPEASMLCPLTKLHNGAYFVQVLEEKLKLCIDHGQNASFLVIDIDNLVEVNHLYGNDVGNEIIRNMASIIAELKTQDQQIYKLSGPVFAFYTPNKTRSEAYMVAEKIRYEISRSSAFVHPMTVSIGIVSLDEFRVDSSPPKDIVMMLLRLGRTRVTIAKKNGMNSVCYSSSIYEDIKFKPKALIIDNDIYSYEILSQILTKMGWEVFWGKDGEEAIKIVETQKVQIIVSEIMVPKIGGFEIRESLMQFADYKKIPFLVVSHRKNDESIKRALTLEIEHFFKKPYNINELVGIMSSILRRN